MSHSLLRICNTINEARFLGSGCGRVVEWSRALDLRLREWCCSVPMVWGKNKNLTAQKSVHTAVLSIKTAFNLVKIHLLSRIIPLIQWSIMICRPCLNRFWGLKYIPLKTLSFENFRRHGATPRFYLHVVNI
jgi:hypothetical protein